MDKIVKKAIKFVKHYSKVTVDKAIIRDLLRLVDFLLRMTTERGNLQCLEAFDLFKQCLKYEDFAIIDACVGILTTVN